MHRELKHVLCCKLCSGERQIFKHSKALHSSEITHQPQKPREMQKPWDITLEATSSTEVKLRGVFEPISKCVIDKLECGAKTYLVVLGVL